MVRIAGEMEEAFVVSVELEETLIIQTLSGP
jgi:hypothetical protein